MALCAGMLAGCKHDSITPEKPKTDEEVIPGAGKLEEFSTPGIYKTESTDLVSPLRVYSQGSDQQSIVSKSSSTGYRVMNLQEGQMLSICVGAKTFSENKSYSVTVMSFGIPGLESEYTSNVSLVKKDGKILYFSDDNKPYVYLIKTK